MVCFLPQQLHEAIVYFFVGDAVHQHIRAFFDRGARGLQLSRVHGDAQFVRMTFFDSRAHDRAEAVDRMIFVDDVPNLDQVGILRREFADELPRLFGRVDLHNRWIAEIELRTRHARDQWSGHGHARCFGRRVRDLAHFEIPKRPADIDHRGNAAAQIALERVGQIFLNQRDLVRVGPDLR